MNKQRRWILITFVSLSLGLLFLYLIVSINSTNNTETSAIDSVKRYVIYEKGELLNDTTKTQSHMLYDIGIIFTEMESVNYPDFKINKPEYTILRYDELKYKSYFPFSRYEYIAKHEPVVFEKEWIYISYGNNNPRNTTFIFAIDTKSNYIHCMFDSNDSYCDAYGSIRYMAQQMDAHLFETASSELKISNIKLS